MSEKIEMTKSGLKFSYKRFLADSASGYLVSLVIVVAAYKGKSILGIPLQVLVEPNLPREGKIFIFLMIFLFSTPLGMGINAMSWLLLRRIESIIKNCLYKEKKLSASFKRKHLFNDCKKELKITKDDWQAKYSLINETLRIQHPDSIKNLEHARGIRIFFRNIAFLIAVAIPLFMPSFNYCIWLLLFFFLSIMLSAVLSFYVAINVFLIGYIVSHNDKNFLTLIKLPTFQ